MHGVIGRVSPNYLRDPLIKTHGEPAGAGGHVRIGEGIEEGRIGGWKRILQPVKKSALPSFVRGARVVRYELTHPIRKMPFLQKPATVEGVHPDPDEPGCIPDVVEPGGCHKVRGFLRLEDSGNFLVLSRDTLGVRKAIGQGGEKLAGQVLSGCGRFSHQLTR